MKRKNVLSVILAVVLLVGCTFTGCTKKPPKPSEFTVTFDVGEQAMDAGVSTPDSQTVKRGEKVVEPVIDYWDGHELIGWFNGSAEWNFSTDTVSSNITLIAEWSVAVTDEVAKQYEENLTWGEVNHLYVHYLRGAHAEDENGTANTAQKPDYSTQIQSSVYGDWGLWTWEYFPTNSEGRAFYPMKIDESGAVYDIDLTATYTDAGWDSTLRTHKGLTISYAEAKRVGIQVYSQDSRLNGTGFWVNDGGDVYIVLNDAKREKGDYHWFIRQGATQDGASQFAASIVDDPYAGLAPGEAVTKYDVVSNKGNNDVYKQQPVAEGWDENSVGYQIFIASFADSDGDGMGDLRGIINKLGYLDELGVDTLWLTPFQHSNSYHGYDIMDYFTVDPRFGTLDDYRELVYKAHQKGMKIVMDFVLNHTSLSNPWFAKSQSLKKQTITLPDGTKKVIDYRNFYTWQNEEYVSSLKDERAKKQWFKDANGYYFYSSFGSSMPELNYDYQGTRDAILEVALYWMSFGLDGFRLDAVKHIYMANESRDRSDWVVSDIDVANDADYSFDMNKNLHFFMEFNAKLKASYSNAILVGENFNGDPTKLAGLYGGLDSQFNFNWYYDGTAGLNRIAKGEDYAASILNQYLVAQTSFMDGRTDYIDGIFTSNHDVQRARDKLFLTDVGLPRTAVAGDDDWVLSENLAKLWGGMCLTVPGLTWIYNGDEIGMFGVKTANPAGDGVGHEDRWYRQPMKWTTALEDSSYNCNYLMGFNNYRMTWDALNMQLDGAFEQSTDATSVYSLYKKVIEIRKAYNVANGKLVSHTTEGSLMDYSIKSGDKEIRVLVNASKQDIAVPSGIGGTVVYGVVTGGKVPAMSMIIYGVKG
ncbi:MAG: hypothetical protein K2M95_02665 [Clostridiales bacterium]|nr:hypothetical protein [Clostridiales bacterium]